MKIKINPKKGLLKWGPIEIRLIYASLFLEVAFIRTTENYPWFWPPALGLFKKGRMVWVLEDLALRKVGLNYFKKYFLNLKNYKDHWKKWERWVDEYKSRAKNLEKLDFKKLTNKELCSELESFCDLERRFWTIVHVPEIANWGGEYLLKQKLKKISKEKVDHYLEVLSTPVKLSFFQQEELDLLKLASIKKKEEFKEALRNHAKKHHWILNSYGGSRVLTSAYFESELKQLIKEKTATQKIREIKNVLQKNQKRKTQLIKKLKLDKELALVAEQLSQSIWWQDLRKGYIWRMNYFWDKFIKEVAKRTNWKFGDILYCYTDELLAILKGKKVNKIEILKRKGYYVFYTEEGKFEDSTYEKFVKELFDIYLKVDVGKMKEIKGLPVSKGKTSKTKGIVKIITDPFKDSKKMKQGDILVAGMTSPEYIIVMRKAKAIITDHGGMTSHAAIVSRELKIPCVVGTKIATKVLKDGDEVEVDANKGVIKILKKTK